MSELISVCLCTYKGKFLSQAIETIISQELPLGTECELIVVDNDCEASAERAVASIAKSSFPIRYSIERKKGLSFARSRAISLSAGTWLALIDDDELAEPSWIAELLKTAKSYSADAVMGVVLPKFLSEPPRWIENGRYFSRTYSCNGAKLLSGRTGNALVNSVFVKTHGISFDLSFNSTGGEDTDFFQKLISAGGIIVSCKDAIVREQIPPERLTSTYLKRRAVRSGETYARVFYNRVPTTIRTLGFCRAAINATVASLLAIGFLPFGRSLYYSYYIVMLRNIGKIRFFLGVSPIEIYK